MRDPRVSWIFEKKGLLMQALVRLALPRELPVAVERLRDAVSEGGTWAVEMVVSYSLPKPKPIDPNEIADFEERLEHLEQLARKH
jgi:DNA repair ATPase RecN